MDAHRYLVAYNFTSPTVSGWGNWKEFVPALKGQNVPIMPAHVDWLRGEITKEMEASGVAYPSVVITGWSKYE